jgi:hypothetical protein
VALHCLLLESVTYFFNFPFSYLISAILTQIGILAHAFPPSRARSLAFATFSSGAALGAAFGNAMCGALTEFTQYEFSRTLPLFLTSTNLFDPEKHGVPRSTY